MLKVVPFYNYERQNRRLDSKQFRWPKTCRPPCRRLHERKTKRMAHCAS